MFRPNNVWLPLSLADIATACGFTPANVSHTHATSELDDDAVTYAKLQNVSATDKVLGRSTAGAGNAEEIPCTASGRALIAGASVGAQRTTLGLGTADAVTFSYVTLPGGLRLRGFTSSALPPTTSDLPTAKDCSIHQDTNLGTITLSYNDAGTIKSVALV